jgi:hypothetical protein
MESQDFLSGPNIIPCSAPKYRVNQPLPNKTGISLSVTKRKPGLKF